MSSSFGEKLKVTIFGASHGSHIGVVLEGLDAGEVIDQEALAQFMQRRAPKKNVLSTQRREADTTPLCLDTKYRCPFQGLCQFRGCATAFPC